MMNWREKRIEKEKKKRKERYSKFFDFCNNLNNRGVSEKNQIPAQHQASQQPGR
jgi:hypothetical protein